MALSNPVAERIVLAGIYKYGAEAYHDVIDVITDTTFTIDANINIYNCFKAILDNDDSATIDVGSVQSAANNIGLSSFFANKDEIQHLQSIMKFDVDLSNVRKYAIVIRKIEMAKQLRLKLDEAQQKLMEVQGIEPINDILDMAEKTVFDFTASLGHRDELPTRIGDGIKEYFEYLSSNPVQQIGVATGFPRYDSMIGGGLRPGTVNVIGARPKVGKEQPISSIVYTPNGPITMGQIQVGDMVCTPFSNTSKVIDIFAQGSKPIYEISFSDNTTARCGLEHLWEVKSGQKNEYELKTLKELMDDLVLESNKPKWQLRLTKPVKYNKKNVSIDPYLLGLLLGDGSVRNCVSITTVDQEVLDYVVDTVTDDKSHTKFIPKNYIYNDIETRVAILQGLMDTCGTVEVRGNCAFYSTSLQLINDVQEIVHSLGGLATICDDKSFKSYVLHIKFNDNSICFKLSRKKNRCHQRIKQDLIRQIVDIKYVGEEECRCILIDDERHLYLTNNHIVTHNTILSATVCVNIAKQMPVIHLDTEMLKSDHQHRMAAALSDVDLDKIETGKYAQNQYDKQRVDKALDQLENLPYYHRRIGGMQIEEQLATIRRWLLRSVGLRADGTANQCVLVYDYLKLMNAKDVSSNLQEYQALGFLMTSLHDFTVRYNIPMLALMQLNRDGITKEGTDVASGSDRIIWLCSNFTIFKEKSQEEIAKDGRDNGNRKLVPIIARHGSAITDGDYINCKLTGRCTKLEELTMASELEHDNNGFDTNGQQSTF